MKRAHAAQGSPGAALRGLDRRPSPRRGHVEKEATGKLKRLRPRADRTRAVNNVDLRLVERFRIAQRLNRGGRDEVHALDDLRARLEVDRSSQRATTGRLADVIRFPGRD
jgi:hypothetical protein